MGATITIAMTAAALALAGCGGSGDGEADGPLAVSGRFGALEFEAEPLAPPSAGPNALRIALRELDSGEPFAGASLKATAIMPSMGHESPTEALSEEPEAGMYEVTNLVFTMAGRWEVRCRAERGSLVDEAAFTYEVR